MRARSLILCAAALAALPAVAAGNPCATGKPGLDPELISRPAGYRPMDGDAALGAKLWNDTALSTNGMSCNTCHQNHGSFQASFAKPYPHAVQMVRERFGLKSVQLDEMIQACLLMPMAAQPLPWDSRALAALVAHARSMQKSFKPGAKAPANPCSVKPANPCAAKSANPCAKK